MSLGLGTSKKVGFNVSISYPLTYALPGESLYNAKSSLGVSPPAVNCPDLYTPLFPILSSKDSRRVTSKGLTS